ncbi:hypothetical protein B0H67DRAFT_117166 [Lasiosphaeris hirsuta]|uniref:Cytochrome b5 heme-binding domain-containing protein n=1 Tax=Lasiosphaeris hirsuta TaxID=260670 RepID=A0AA40AZG4_9PEZI|nr:hypothetical protein B0H67DRAFT_117166 [Lasiosphaeris hirsuta]
MPTMSTTHYLGTAGDVGWDPSVPRDPDTPWRESFGGISDPTYARRGESGFAPQLPRIPNPIGMGYTLDKLSQLQPMPKPTDDEIDKLYLHERFQGLHSFGLRTWQLPSINHGLPPQGTISVNEAGWHPAFRKDRWFDYRGPRGTWSVDDPRVWEHLRVAIELANRMLERLLKTRWLEAVFFAPREDVKDDVPRDARWADVPSSGGHNIPKVIDLLAPEHVVMSSQEQHRVYKESLDLSFYIHWTAFDKYDLDGYGHYNRAHALSHAYTQVVYGRDGEWLSPFVAICMSTENLNTLPHVQGTTADEKAQRYMAQFQMASTLVHELMHAFGEAQYIHRQNIHSSRATIEPMLKSEGISELGLSAEKRLFGGVIRVAPTPLAAGYAENSLNYYRPYALGLFRYPEDPFWAGLLRIYPDRWKDPQVTERYVIPTIYAANMEQERYWTNIVAKFGTNSMKVPRYLRAPVLQPFDMFRVWSPRETEDLSKVFVSHATELDQLYRGVLNDFRDRKKIYDYLRPWHDECYKKWQLSPYSQIMFRVPISSFGEAVRQQDKKWAYAAMQELRTRLMYMNEFVEDNPMQMIPHLNLFNALVVLMGAVLPWEENQEMHEFSIRAKSMPNRWFPSQSAEHKTRFRFLDSWGPGSSENYEWASGGPVMSAYYDKGPIDGREMTIRLGEQTVESWVTLVPSHHNLTSAVLRLAESLRRQVNDLARNPRLDASGWLRWDFEFPPYNPQLYLNDPHAKYTDPNDGQEKEKNLWRKYDARTRYTEDDTPLLLSPGRRTSGGLVQDEAEMVADWRKTRLTSDQRGVNRAVVEQEAQEYWATRSARNKARQQTQAQAQSQVQTQWPPQRASTYAPTATQPVYPQPPSSQRGTHQLSAAATAFVPSSASSDSRRGSSQPGHSQTGGYQPGYGGVPWNVPSAGGQAKRASLVIKKLQQKQKNFETEKADPVVFWSVGEVADHRSDADRWVLLSDGRAGFDVFDISGVSSLQGDKFALKTTLTENGRILGDERAIKRVHHRHDELFVGKLLLEKELTEILEHDGEDGRRKWVYVGYDVFDITDFPFVSDEERRVAYSAASKGFVGHIVRHSDDLFARLTPYRCAKLFEPRASDISLSLPKHVFTVKDVSRRIFPGNGMATVIDGKVYQLGDWTKDFADFHPGGRQVIHDLAGRDATAEFISAHENWEELLEKMDHIGYVVPERPLGFPIRESNSEVQYGSIVYKMDREAYVSGQLIHRFGHIEPAQDQLEARAHFEQRYAELQRYIGLNVTALNKVADRRTLFASLLNVPELAVAYVTGSPSRSVTAAELAENSEYHLPSAETPNMAPHFGKVWVSIKNIVYDVTDLARYANDEIKKKISSFGGSECTDPSLAHDIVACHLAPVVGKLASELEHQKQSRKRKQSLDEQAGTNLRQEGVKQVKINSNSQGVA